MPELTINNIPLPGHSLQLVRIDQVDPNISGNKWYKLKYNLQNAVANGYTTILTFGGAYSNHIHATAAAAKKFKLYSIGIIRGEETLPLNPTLSYAKGQGMKLHYISRSDYRRKSDPQFITALRERYGNFFLIPEGGSNELAVKGVAEIVEGVDFEAEYWITPVGTGGTMAGLISGVKDESKVLGISALKGAKGLNDDVKNLLEKTQKIELSNWEINHNYHFGGYAKMDQELVEFIQHFKASTGILLDPVYTSKMMYGIFDLVKKGCFKQGAKIIALHTGGLQGWNGMKDRYPFTKDLLPLD